MNPYPIFARHLTIPELCHTPQTSKCRGPHMIEMVRDLEEYAIFYNGPLCGASAPDHMHFQACPKFELPLVEAIEKRMPATTESVELQASLGFPFGFYVVDINKKLEATMAIDTVRALYSVIDPSLNEEDYMTHEPKINIICFDSATRYPLRNHSAPRASSVELRRRPRTDAHFAGQCRPRRCVHYSAQGRFRCHNSRRHPKDIQRMLLQRS